MNFLPFLINFSLKFTVRIKFLLVFDVRVSSTWDIISHPLISFWSMNLFFGLDTCLKYTNHWVLSFHPVFFSVQGRWNHLHWVINERYWFIPITASFFCCWLLYLSHFIYSSFLIYSFHPTSWFCWLHCCSLEYALVFLRFLTWCSRIS